MALPQVYNKSNTTFFHQVDENQDDDGMFIHSDSLNSFDQVTATSIIKQECTHLASTTLSPGLQSPEPIEDRDLLIP